MKTYRIYWDERVTHCATVYADSDTDAIDALNNSEYAEIDIVNTEMLSGFEVVSDENQN